jgi:uncharacterized protein (TIRG00374 family)
MSFKTLSGVKVFLLGRVMDREPRPEMVNQENTTNLENGEKIPALWGWHTYLSVGITIAILVALAAVVDLDRVWQEVAVSKKTYILLGMLAHYGTYPVRGLRWRRCMIHLPVQGGTAKFGLLVFFYNFVDNVVPGKLGDLYGAHLARINFRIRRSAALGSIVFLRMVDAWFVLGLASLASWLLFSNRLPQAVVWALIGGGAVALATTLIMLPFFLVKKSLPRWMPEKIQQMVHSFRAGMWPRASEIIPVAVLTMVIWILEMTWIFFLALGFGLRLSSAEAIFLTMIPLLATAFPLTPSGAGVVELTLFGCLRAVGVPAPVAVSLTVVNRFIDYWLHIGLGVFIWALRAKFGLRTWREVPLTDFNGTYSLKTSVGLEDAS